MKFYLAAPFFNPEQVSVVEKIKAIVEASGHEVFSPMHDNYCEPNASNKRRQDVIDKNLASVSKCNYIIVSTNFFDWGTAIEAGIAINEKKKIIYFCSILGTNPFNLMLAKTAYSVAKSLEELDDIVKHVSDIKYLDKYNYKGLIE